MQITLIILITTIMLVILILLKIITVYLPFGVSDQRNASVATLAKHANVLQKQKTKKVTVTETKF